MKCRACGQWKADPILMRKRECYCSNAIEPGALLNSLIHKGIFSDASLNETPNYSRDFFAARKVARKIVGDWTVESEEPIWSIRLNYRGHEFGATHESMAAAISLIAWEVVKRFGPLSAN